MGIKQKDLAQKTGIHFSNINRYVNGWTGLTANRTVLVAKELGITVEEVEKREVLDHVGKIKKHRFTCPACGRD